MISTPVPPDAWPIACLRYFNPVGAHPSGRIGENPLGIPNNLFPFVSQVAVGRRAHLQVFGGDWPTPNGTGVRDYIHVMDLAEGHRATLDCLMAEAPQLLTLNLGRGREQFVLEVEQAMEAAISMADPSQAAQRLGWRTKRGLEDICRDGWAWQKQNPGVTREPADGLPTDTAFRSNQAL